jgi:hypothetical protein
MLEQGGLRMSFTRLPCTLAHATKEDLWQQVVHSADCDEDGNCPICKDVDFGDCPCPGPTSDGYEYAITSDGVLVAREDHVGVKLMPHNDGGWVAYMMYGTEEFHVVGGEPWDALHVLADALESRICGGGDDEQREVEG